MKTGIVSRYITPIATRLFAPLPALIDRRALVWWTNKLFDSLDSNDRFTLVSILFRHKIIKIIPNIEPLKLAEGHFCKTVTARALNEAAVEFIRTAGRNDLLMVSPLIISGERAGEVPEYLRQSDPRQLLAGIFPHVLRYLPGPTHEERIWSKETIKKAFDLAGRLTNLRNEELIYRIQKMADIGGNNQAVLAALFYDLDPTKFDDLQARAAELGLGEVMGRVLVMIKNYQAMRNAGAFDAAQIKIDKTYLKRKMDELIKSAVLPETLLIYFLDRLDDSRQAAGDSSPLSGEIRFLLAPLAERLGLVYLAEDFRDQNLRLSQPQKYEFIEQQVRSRINMSYESAKIFLATYVKALYAHLKDRLRSEYYGLVIRFRVKSPYSIWNKVEERHEYQYHELPDVLGIKIICDSEAAMLAVRQTIKRSRLFMVTDGQSKEVLTNSEKGNWRGIKLVGRDAANIPIEIQIMTEEMNQDNNQGKAAAWLYNLRKDLNGVEQEFEGVEPKEVMTADYYKNFYQIWAYLPVI